MNFGLNFRLRFDRVFGQVFDLAFRLSFGLAGVAPSRPSYALVNQVADMMFTSSDELLVCKVDGVVYGSLWVILRYEDESSKLLYVSCYDVVYATLDSKSVSTIVVSCLGLNGDAVDVECNSVHKQ